MFVLSRGFIQAAITARDASGKATARHALRTNVFAPKLWEYGVPFSVLEGRTAGKTWTVCVVPDGVVLPAAALSDPDIAVFCDTEADRTIPIPSGKAATLSAKLLTTDLGITLAVDETPNSLVQKIVTTAFGAVQFSVADLTPGSR